MPHGLPRARVVEEDGAPGECPHPNTLTFPQGTSNYGSNKCDQAEQRLFQPSPHFSLSNHHWCQAMTPLPITMSSTFKAETGSKSWPACIGVGRVLKPLFVCPRKVLPSHLLQAGAMDFEARHARSSPGAGQNPGWDRAFEGEEYGLTAEVVSC